MSIRHIIRPSGIEYPTNIMMTEVNWLMPREAHIILTQGGYVILGQSNSDSRKLSMYTNIDPIEAEKKAMEYLQKRSFDSPSIKMD